MNALILGSGGREHALAWKIRQSPVVREVFCIPGNPGTAALATNISIAPSNFNDLVTFVRDNRIDLTIVGPEQPLAAGIVDRFLEEDLLIFGPTRAAAQLEWSKAFAKSFMKRHGIPTAAFKSFSRVEIAEARQFVNSLTPPVVVKADGLAAGKGVVICSSREVAEKVVREILEERLYGEAGDSIVIEEFLTGTEASVFAISDGERYAVMAPAQDHKRIFSRDKGPNTGGMGAFAPTPAITEDLLQRISSGIIEPTLQGMKSEGSPFQGCLFLGLMLTESGPQVIEYNVRFGDPETQVVLPVFPGDLFEILYDAARGNLLGEKVETVKTRGAAVCVVMASGGYPGSFSIDKEISGLEAAGNQDNVVVFHAGTKEQAGKVLTSGGRVLGVTAFDPSGSIAGAAQKAYEAVGNITFESMHYRDDIGMKGIGLQFAKEE